MKFYVTVAVVMQKEDTAVVAKMVMKRVLVLVILLPFRAVL